MATVRALAIELSAETAAFMARMSAAGQAVTKIGASGASAHRGVTLLRGGLEQLAFSAVGLEGPIGNVVSGILNLGGGGGAALVAAATIGGLAFAMHTITAPTDTATKALQDFTKGLRTTRDAGDQLRQLLQDLGGGEAKTIGLMSGIQGALSAMGGIGAGLGGGAQALANRSVAAGNQAAQAARDALNASRSAAATKLITDLELQTAALFSNSEQLARVTAAQLHLNATDTEALVIATRKHEAAIREQRDLLVRMEIMDQLAQRRIAREDALRSTLPAGQFMARTLFTGSGALPDLGTAKVGQPVQFIGAARELAQALLELKEALLKTGKGAQDAGQAALNAARSHQLATAMIVSSVSSLIAGLVSGGGIGGFLQSAGGLLGLLVKNPIIGAVVAGVGQVFSAFDSNEERRHGELLHALEPIGEVLFLVTNRTGDPDADDALVRRIEQATGRRISVRFGAKGGGR